jgi:hypothetical protein
MREFPFNIDNLTFTGFFAMLLLLQALNIQNSLLKLAKPINNFERQRYD